MIFQNIKFLFSISFRNLLRQKRRNILLGSAMAFGVMILVIASSFAAGVSDVLFNKIVVYVAGHINVGVTEGRGVMRSVIRDKARFIELLKREAGGDLVRIDEGLGTMVRAIGNGRTENMVLVGVDSKSELSEQEQSEFEESFNMQEGKWQDLHSTEFENPLILSKEKAEILNVKKGDTVRVRLTNIHNQVQAARLTVAGIITNDNMFMSGVMFVELDNLKTIMGLRPWESGPVQMVVKNPKKNAVRIADNIHKALEPGPAFIFAKAENGTALTVLPFMGNDDAKKEIIRKEFTLAEGSMDEVLKRDGCMISDKLALALNLKTGDKLRVYYKPKFMDEPAEFSADVAGIFVSDAKSGESAVYAHEALFYAAFYPNLPDLEKDRTSAFLPAKDASFYSALGSEWVLLDRSRTTEDMMKKQRDAAKRKIRAAVIDVNSMYESASDVLKLEVVLNLITIGAVAVLFFIIIIGVINTLRMTIRERTREIGTIRAIGMQKRDVRIIFILETTLLALFAAITGVLLAAVAMVILSSITVDAADNPLSILLVKKHLFFMPTAGAILFNCLMLLVIAALTAFFPAKKAANLSSAEALRHYE